MVHSIRWRLTASFTLLTLLTITLLGVIVLTLMQRTLEREANDFLNANAQAVARQSSGFFQPALQTVPLYQLAQTTAFLGDVQVRILDERREVVAAAGLPGGAAPAVWVMSNPAVAAPAVIVATTRDELSTLPIEPPPVPQVDMFSVRKLPSPWGDRLDFHAVDGTLAQPASVSLSITTTTFPLPISGTFASAGAVGSQAFQVVTPIESDDTVVGYVELSTTPNFIGTTLAVIRQAFLIAAGVVTVLSLGLGLVISRGLTAPLAGLTEATARMNDGDLSARAPIHGRDEIGLLAQQFNQMAAALEASFAQLAAERDALRRFVADASHELRTPITALRTFIDLLAGESVHDTATTQEFLGESQGQISRLERITNNLLNLSRLEGGLIQLRPAEHDLTDLLIEVTTPFKAIAQERQLELQIHMPTAPARLYGDHNQIDTALSNLLDNALKFTQPGGQIQVGSEITDQGIELWVKDNGPGIEAEEVAYIFERFHRGRTATGHGNGLGLAIVQTIMQAHGGTVTMISQPGLGSRFTLSFPYPPTAL